MKRLICAGLMVVGVVAAGVMGQEGATTSSGGGDVPAGKRVTLHCKDAPAKVVLDDLCKQMGVTWSTAPVDNGSWPAVTLDVEDRPYWEVADKLTKVWGAGFFPVRGNKLVVTRDTGDAAWNPGEGARVISGPVMLAVRTVQHDIDLKKPAGQQHVSSLGLWLSWEPQLKVAAMRCGPAEVVVDENGRNLAAAQRPGIIQFTFSNYGWYRSTSVPLAVDGEAGRKLAVVKGKAYLYLPEKTETVEILAADFARPVTMKVGGALVELSVRDAGSPGLVVRLVRGALNEAEWALAADLVGAAEVEMEDAAGVGLVHGPMAWTRGDQQRTLTIPFSSPPARGGGKAAGAPAKCKVVMPGAFEELAVPYEFRGLALP